jgi:hypothetical protein
MFVLKIQICFGHWLPYFYEQHPVSEEHSTFALSDSILVVRVIAVLLLENFCGGNNTSTIRKRLLMLFLMVHCCVSNILVTVIDIMTLNNWLCVNRNNFLYLHSLFGAHLTTEGLITMWHHWEWADARLSSVVDYERLPILTQVLYGTVLQNAFAVNLLYNTLSSCTNLGCYNVCHCRRPFTLSLDGIKTW